MGAIGDLRGDDKRLRTCNAYLRSVKAFTRWLRDEKRAPDDNLVALAGFNADTDRRYIRREMAPEELAYLLATVETYTMPQHNLSGRDRAMAYRVALGTGFRSKELRSLTPESFDLDSDPPTVTVQAACSKRRRLDVQPIRQDLADILRPWLADCEPGEHPFANMPEQTARMLRDDLDEARRRWLSEAETDAQRAERKRSDFLQHKDAAGRAADFHGLRHAYISALVAGGASVKTAQELARHSTPNLTIGRYSHTRLHDIQGALDALPDLRPQDAGKEEQVAAATGTDGPAAHGSRSGSSRDAKPCMQAAKPRERHAECFEESDFPQVVSISTLSGNRREPARRDKQEAPVGVEPTVADLQSAALATWRRRQPLIRRLSDQIGSVNRFDFNDHFGESTGAARCRMCALGGAVFLLITDFGGGCISRSESWNRTCGQE